MKRHQADRKVWIYVILVLSGHVGGENRKGRGAFFLHLLTFPPFGILVFLLCFTAHRGSTESGFFVRRFFWYFSAFSSGFFLS